MFASLRLLRLRNYALVWWSGLFSNAGSWMQTVAIGALITDLTHSAAWGGLIAGASFMASGLMTPAGGVVADKWNRRALMLLVSLASAAVAVLLAVLFIAGLVTPEVLLVLVIIEGCLLGFVVPAMGAMTPDLVPKEHIADASAMGNASWNLGRCIGPALAGVVIAYGSYSLVFVINALSYIGVAIAMFFVRVPAIAHATGGTFVQRLREGIRGSREDEGCWAAVCFIAITALFVSPFIALMPAVAQLVFHGTAVDTAHFTMSQGIGSVVGAFAFAALVRRFGRGRVIVVLLIALPLSEMAYAVAPSKWFGVAGAFLLGAFYIAITVGMTVIVQLRAEPHLRARVLALNFMTLACVYPVGATIQGRLADWFGIREVLFTAPLIYLAVLAVIAIRDPGRYRSLGAATVAT